MRTNTLLGIFFIGFSLSGCAQKKSVPMVPNVPYKVAPQLIAGCLRPTQSMEAMATLPEVKLNVTVSSTGVPTGVSVVKASGSDEQDALVMQAIKLCEFTPGKIDSVPSSANYSLTYRWTVGEARNGLMRCFPGDFPTASMALGEAGTAVVSILREPNDEIRIQLEHSTGHHRLDRQTLIFARRCLEHPSVRADFPTGEALKQSITWALVD